MTEPTSTTGLIASILGSSEGMSKSVLALGGLFGGLISLRFDNQMNLWQRITAVITSVILGDIGGQPLADILSDGRFAGGAAVMIGLFWLVVVGTAVKGFRQTDVAGIVKGLFDALNSRISGGK